MKVYEHLYIYKYGKQGHIDVRTEKKIVVIFFYMY